MCVLTFSTIFVWNIFHSKKNWARYDKKNTYLFLCLSDFKESWIFSEVFSKKKTQKSNFVTIRPVGADMFQADGRTDMTSLIITFRHFEKAPKNRRPRKMQLKSSMLGISL